MTSCAETLMDYCQAKGIGKVGETLFFGMAFNDEQNADILLFNDADGGSYMRRLDGIAYHLNYVSIRAIGSIPADCFAKLERSRVELEKIRKQTLEGGMWYEIVLAQSPPKMVYYTPNNKFVYDVIYKVMRKIKGT